MNIKKSALVAAVSASLLAGSVIGSTALSTAASNSAQSGTSQSAATGSGGPPPGAPGGKFRPNENGTHEKGESAQREAQESAGQVPTVP